MRKVLLFSLLAFSVHHFTYAQCTTNNATSCQCKDGSTDCNLLPDIILANEPLEASGNNGNIEYSQTGNGAENGRLRVSVSTPNIGRGPLTVRASSIFICGTDTFTSNPGTCPGGGSPRNLCFQRVYHKNGSTMTYSDRPAGSMTYHPTHNHMHVDDWGVYTLRIRDTAIADPMQWPMLGSGAKLGFCLMDYGTCSYYNGHCVDSLGNTLLNGDFPNYGLGGGNYNCDPTEQGISSGYTDIYYQYLDGMYITIPPGTCNGEYYIVVKIDPHDYFLEEKEDNNVIAIPFTLTKQVPAGTGSATITPSVPSTNVCEGSSVTLTANSGNSYLWNTNDTTQSISTTQPGNYSVEVTSQCGTATSAPVTITNIASNVSNVTDATVCSGTAITLSASASGVAHWFDTITGGNELYIGDTYVPVVTATTTFYVESHDTLLGVSGNVGPADNTFGPGSYYNNDQHQIFTVYKPLVLKTVKVFANSAKNRTIELRSSTGAVLQSRTVNIPQGTQIVNLDFAIAPGVDYELGWTSGSSPDLFRNSDGASYPYTINNLISVTDNSANDLDRWYCLYDWQIQEQPVACTSTRVPVTATVVSLPNVTMSGLSSQYYDTDSAVMLTGTPEGGTFSGTGVTDSLYDPSVAGVGGPYTITYQYTDSNGCIGSSTFDVTVLLDNSSGIQHIEGISKVNIFPNPNNGRFELTFKSNGSKRIDLSVTNILGQKILDERNIFVNNSLEKSINLGNVPQGVYQLVINSGKKQNTYKVIIE